MSEISRRSFGTAVLAAAGAPMMRAAAAGRPNILFICSDEHGSPFLGVSGHPIVKTPNLDRLAASGVFFRNAYCGSPVCVPSRAGLMSGMFPSDVGSYCNSTPFRKPVPSWGNRLRDGGYECWATGKLDLTHGTDYGFHEIHTRHGHSINPDITSLFRAPLCYRTKIRNDVKGTYGKSRPHDEAVLENAGHLLREEIRGSSKPWVIYAGFTAPHYPFATESQYESVYPPESMPLPDVPLEYLDKRHPVFSQLANFQGISSPIAAKRIRRARSAYFGMITDLDRRIGLLLDALEKSGQAERTLIVYTSDHGEMLGDNGLWFKNVLLENAVRVPLILAGAGLPRGKTIAAPVMHADLVATMLEMAGARRDAKLRGHSLLPLIRSEAGSHPGVAYSESHSEGNCTGSFMIRKANWKYIYATGYEPIFFDLRRDPGEQHNLAGNPETEAVQKELHTELLRLVPDPDAVTERAFAAQQVLLEEMIRKNTRHQFFEALKSRLGAGQAAILASQFYRRRKA